MAARASQALSRGARRVLALAIGGWLALLAGSCSEDGAPAASGKIGGGSGKGGTSGTGTGASGGAGGTGGGASGGTSGTGGGPGGSSGGVSGSGGSGAAGAADGSADTGGSAGVGGTGGTGGTAPRFILGADISSVQEAVERGARYVDTDGQEKGMLELLKNHGFNFIRLRTFVNPEAAYGYASGSGQCQARAEPYCDENHTLEFARQIKGAGFGLLLDFHYSDTWADPGKQIIPEAWRSATTIEDLASRLRAYTADVIGALVSAGARPDMVQIGNEITPGMLLHVPDANTDCWGNGAAGRSGGPTGASTSSNWPNLAALLSAGSQAVKSVDPSIKIVIHIENTGSVSGVRGWVNNARTRGVDFDVLGLSCYPAFQGEPSVWENTFRTLASEFSDLSFIVAEYNPERTRTNQMIHDLPNGLGTFFWEPTQSGEWGPSLFTFSDGAWRANPQDFQEFDRIRQSFGL